MEDTAQMIGQALPNFRMFVGGEVVDDGVGDLAGGDGALGGIEELMGHGAAAARLDRQAWPGAVERKSAAFADLHRTGLPGPTMVSTLCTPWPYEVDPIPARLRQVTMPVRPARGVRTWNTTTRRLNHSGPRSSPSG